MLVLIRKTLCDSLKRSMSLASASIKEDLLDPVQNAALNEKCFLVNDKDEITGTASKKICHSVGPNGALPLHRAFSVFLFNENNELLLQRRSKFKITYPNAYTNTCCSHPIENVPGEESGLDGVIRAAQRRLSFELGIPINQVPREAFKFLTRIHYLDTGDGKWGEHEIDYILFIKARVALVPNSNEVREVRYVSLNQLDDFISNLKGPITPWFNLILNYRLKKWWAALDNISVLSEPDKIVKL